jgi:hypothetical protein
VISPGTKSKSQDLTPLIELVQDEMQMVEDWLATNLIDDNPFVGELLKQIFQAGGKRLRPLIVLLSGKATGKNNEIGRLHIILAVLTELIHTASLVHDDVIDSSDLRRGKETINKKWNEPLMAAGNWVPELIEFACGENLFGEAGKHSPWMNMDDLVKSNPDVILVTPCGFDINRTMSEMHLLLDNPQFAGLSCVKNKRVYVADGNQYFNRPGPRVVESMQMIAEMLYPDNYSSELKGTGFIQI